MADSTMSDAEKVYTMDTSGVITTLTVVRSAQSVLRSWVVLQVLVLPNRQHQQAHRTQRP
jgi:hypothetical protein